MIDQNPEIAHDDPKVAHDDLVEQEVQETLDVNVDDGDALLRRSQRICRPAISSDYVVYVQKHEFDVGDTSDSSTY